jgi:methylated-DNA-[protein]-cysteine S-methyltransferase
VTEVDVVPTPLGPCAVAVSDGVIVRVRLGETPGVPGRRRELPEVRLALAAWFAGRPHEARVAEAPTPFLRRVYEVVRAIPRGRVMSYQEVARAAGSPRAARAVGQAMRRNPTLFFMPCHRVVAASGLGGFSAPGELDTKRRLLALEGAL